MPFYDLVTNAELDQSVGLQFSPKMLVVRLDEKLVKRLKWSNGDRLRVQLDDEATPNIMRMTKAPGEEGWDMIVQSSEEGGYTVDVRQLAFSKIRTKVKADAQIHGEGEIHVKMPPSFVVKPDMIRKPGAPSRRIARKEKAAN